jgi:hypothetical protein
MISDTAGISSSNGGEDVNAWFDEFVARPSMLATPLSGETHDRTAAAALVQPPPAAS